MRNLVMPVTVCVVSVLACGQEIDIASCCRRAAEQMKHIESTNTFKLHGNVVFNGSEYEVWMESRGERVWAQSLRKPVAGSVEAETFKKCGELLNTDMRETTVYNGNAMITYSPVKLQMRIDDRDAFLNNSMKCFFPSSWNSFLIRRTGKATISHFLTDKLADCETRFDSESNRVIVTLANHTVDPSKPVSYAYQRVEIDPVSNLICSIEASGGRAVPTKASFDWTPIEDSWYVRKGKANLGFTWVWEVDEFITDARSVRTSFAFDVSKLPHGTMIVDNATGDARKQEMHFVGGEDGHREYNRLREAIRLIAGRDEGQ